MHHLKQKWHKRGMDGFTLLELSIVLVLIALIVAAITGGATLVQQARLRGTIQDINAYSTAYNIFFNKYGYPPGDLPNAYEYWGADSNCTNATISDSTANNTACNGNGDYKITESYGENVKAWYHLSKAGIIPGTYTGLYATSGLETPENTGSTAIENGCLYYNSSWSGLLYLIGSTSYQNVLLLGGFHTSETCPNMVLKPKEAYNIDKKIDDGRARYGKVGSSNSGWNGTGTCILNDTDYDLANDNIACRQGYLLLK